MEQEEGSREPSGFFPEAERHPGSAHCVPFKPCPLCASEVDLIELDCWLVECPGCGLVFGLPFGYASRLDMAADWNRRRVLDPVDADPKGEQG